MALCHILAKRAERRRALSADHNQTIPWATVSSLALSLSVSGKSELTPFTPRKLHRSVYAQQNGKDSSIPEYFFLCLLLHILPKEGRWHLIQPILLCKLQNQVRTETSISFSYIPRLCTSSTSKPASLLLLSALVQFASVMSLSTWAAVNLFLNTRLLRTLAIQKPWPNRCCLWAHPWHEKSRSEANDGSIHWIRHRGCSLLSCVGGMLELLSANSLILDSLRQSAYSVWMYQRIYCRSLRW